MKLKDLRKMLEHIHSDYDDCIIGIMKNDKFCTFDGFTPTELPNKKEVFLVTEFVEQLESE